MPVRNGDYRQAKQILNIGNMYIKNLAAERESIPK
jgi:hypothetical protein